jgi:hypothetical protein
MIDTNGDGVLSSAEIH